MARLKGQIVKSLINGETKRCSLCKQFKPFSHFYKRSDRPLGLTPRCIECLKPLNRDRANANYLKPGFKETRQEYRLSKLYDLTSDTLDELIVKQDNKCAICEISFDIKPRHIDHVKNSNPPIVRGLLCWNCNLGIGHLMHDLDVLEKATKYLKRAIGSHP